MKLIVRPSSGDEKFEAEITKVSNGINNYILSHKLYRAFQFDCYDRPNHYHESVLPTKWFSGYLIGRGKNQTIECSIQLIK